MNPAVSRITFTPTLLRAARAVLVFAIGAAKREPLRAMVHGADDVNATPAQLVRSVRGAVKILADRAAAG
jgi:6-phosphogluconolactonase